MRLLAAGRSALVNCGDIVLVGSRSAAPVGTLAPVQVISENCCRRRSLRGWGWQAYKVDALAGTDVDGRREPVPPRQRILSTREAAGGPN